MDLYGVKISIDEQQSPAQWGSIYGVMSSLGFEPPDPPEDVSKDHFGYLFQVFYGESPLPEGDVVPYLQERLEAHAVRANVEIITSSFVLLFPGTKK